MTDDRDLDIARRLAELDAPDHRSGFWSDLRAANSTGAASVPDAHVVEKGRSPRLWLAAAAVVLVALVGGAVALDRAGDTQDLSTDPAEPGDPARPDDPGAPGEPDDPLRPDGDPIERGPGRVVAIDPTGEFLYVADDAAGEPGCEGQPAPVLLVEPVDGGERREVLPPDAGSVTGSYQVRFGPAGEIAIVTQCEGFGATVVTGTVGDDGTVSDPTELTIPDLDLGRPVDGILDLEFRSAGILVALTRSVTDDGAEHRHLYEFPVGPSEVTDLGQGDVVHLDATADGRLATLAGDGTIRFDGEIVAEAPGAVDFAISPDGDRLYVAGGSGGVVAVDIVPGNAPRLAPGDGSFSGVVDVPAEGVVITAFGESSWDVRAEEPETAGTVLLRSIAGSEIVVSPDLSRLFVTGRSSDGAPVVLEQALTR